MIQLRNVVFCLLQYKRNMMNESWSMKRREKLSLWLRSSVLSSECAALPGCAVEFLQDVRRDWSDVCEKAQHLA